MNKEQLFGALRTLGVALLTYLVSSGTLTDAQATALTNAATQAAPILGALALAAYGIWKKRDAGKVQDAGKVPGAVVVVNPDAASRAVVNAAISAPNNEVKIGKF